MKNDKAGAAALILGTLSMVGLMAAHPTGHQIMSEDPHRIVIALRGAVVHGVALFATPVLTFGYLRASNWMGFDRPLVSLAFVFYAFAAFAVCVAALMSGFVTGPILVMLRSASAADAPGLHAMAKLASILNQVFAIFHVVMASLAILLWSIAWRPASIAGWAFRIYGLLSGLAAPALLLSGRMHMDVHGAMVVALAQGLFALGMAVALLRDRRDAN